MRATNSASTLAFGAGGACGASACFGGADSATGAATDDAAGVAGRAGAVDGKLNCGLGCCGTAFTGDGGTCGGCGATDFTGGNLGGSGGGGAGTSATSMISSLTGSSYLGLSERTSCRSEEHTSELQSRF